MDEPLLYVFVDESGNPASGNYYVLAGSWCISRCQRAEDVLEATKNRCLSSVGKGISELKGSKLPPNELDVLHASLREYVYDDVSVETQISSWAGSQPLRHTLYSCTPDLAHRTMLDIAGVQHRRTELLKTMSLITILDPIFYNDTSIVSSFPEVRVVLDSSTWQQATTRLASLLDDLDIAVPDTVSFRTEDSKTVPGIQFSDITAYSWARNRRSGDCEQAVKFINERLFDAL
jgi:hypothetical protein